MNRKKLLTKILRSEKQGEQIQLQLIAGISELGKVEVVSFLQEQTHPDRIHSDLSLRIEDNAVIAEKPNPTQEEYLLSFGDENYLLAVVRSGSGYRYISDHERRRKRKIKKEDPRVYFFYPKPLNHSYRRYFSKSFQPQIGIESAARGIARLSKEEDAARKSFDYDRSLVYDARYRATAAAARKLGLTDLAAYLCRRHLLEMIDAGKKAIEKSWRYNLEAVARELIAEGIESTEIRAHGGASIYLQTRINPYRKIVALERKLEERLGRGVLLEVRGREEE